MPGHLCIPNPPERQSCGVAPWGRAVHPRLVSAVLPFPCEEAAVLSLCPPYEPRPLFSEVLPPCRVEQRSVVATWSRRAVRAQLGPTFSLMDRLWTRG